MFGLGDFSVTAAILGSIIVSLFGVIYGAVNWNRGSGEDGSEQSSAAGKQQEGDR